MLTLKGIYGREMFETWYKMRSSLRCSAGSTSGPLITHRLGIHDFEGRASPRCAQGRFRQGGARLAVTGAR